MVQILDQSNPLKLLHFRFQVSQVLFILALLLKLGAGLEVVRLSKEVAPEVVVFYSLGGGAVGLEQLLGFADLL